MFRVKILPWTFAAFCVTTGSCAVLYATVGDEIKMDCAGSDSNSDIEWKFNNALLFYMYKTGRHRKGNLDLSQRTRIEGNKLKISSLKIFDSGVYTCKSSSHTLYVASAQANPSTVIYCGETKLSCDVGGDSKFIFHWLKPKNNLIFQGKEVIVKRATSDHAGQWTCQIKNEKLEILIELKVVINVVGPLITSKNVRISEGNSAELPCYLPTVSRLYITKGSWKLDSPTGVSLLALIRKGSGVQWNQTGIKTDKVGFTDQYLEKDFNITLKKVRISDAGVYVCSLEFEGGTFLSANLTLTVVKNYGSAPDPFQTSEGSTNVQKMPKIILGVQLWIWITVSVLFIVLVALIVISLLIYRRNKRIKKKMKKLKSLQQHKNYCMCNRRSPGKKERPPPLPRHQYSSLNK